MKKEFSQLRMGLNTWSIVLKNLAEENEEVEILWMDSCGDDEELGYALCHDCEMFEYGFKTECEAITRLNEVYVLTELLDNFILPQLEEELNGEYINERQYSYLIRNIDEIALQMIEFYEQNENLDELGVEDEINHLNKLFTKSLKKRW